MNLATDLRLASRIRISGGISYLYFSSVPL